LKLRCRARTAGREDPCCKIKRNPNPTRHLPLGAQFSASCQRIARSNVPMDSPDRARVGPGVANPRGEVEAALTPSKA
jgi:hypothetical protein